MDSSVDYQLQTIRDATQALLQTEGQWKSLTITIDWEQEVYETKQSFFILPKGLKVSGSWENLKIEFQTGQVLTEIPEVNTWTKEKLQELSEATNYSFLTMFGVFFVVAFLFDLLFKKVVR